MGIPSQKIAPPSGKLLVLTPGMGAVSTTFFAGVETLRRGKGLPVGSLTQMQTIRVGRRSENRNPKIKELVPLAELDDLVMAGWDVTPDNAYEAALRASVLKPHELELVAGFLRGIRPMTAAFEPRYVKRLAGDHVKPFRSKADLVKALRDDIRGSIEASGASRAVMVWCGSTEVYLKPARCHDSPETFERGLAENDPAIPPSQLYAYAAILEGVPYANGAPNLSADVPALEELGEAGFPAPPEQVIFEVDTARFA